MFFSRALLHTDLDEVGELARLAATNLYRAHQLVWNLFDNTPDQKRDYLYRRDTLHGRTIFYVVSLRAPSPRSELWEVETKPYSPVIAPGESMAFRVRINPVVERPGEEVLGADGRPKLRTNGKRAGEAKRKVKRHDVVMDAKKKMGRERWEEHFSLNRLNETARAWLEDGGRAAKHGFSIQSLTAHSYTQHRVWKKGDSSGLIHFSTLDLEGALTVNDPKSFRELLFTGIGPAKAFGCGLMLVRRL